MTGLNCLWPPGPKPSHRHIEQQKKNTTSHRLCVVLVEPMAYTINQVPTRFFFFCSLACSLFWSRFSLNHQSRLTRIKAATTTEQQQCQTTKNNNEHAIQGLTMTTKAYCRICALTYKKNTKSSSFFIFLV